MGGESEVLGTVLERLDQYDPDHAIYVDKSGPPGLATPALVAPRGYPPAGMSYLLEVWLAQECLDVWRSWRSDATPTHEDKVAAVIYYAQRDAYLPVEDPGAGHLPGDGSPSA
jgi:hypothetical protein